MKTDVPPMLIQQRIRNRIYEYVGGVSEYSVNPGAWDLNEAVNEWEMYVSDPFDHGAFPAPAFVPVEIDAIANVHAAWLAFADATPQVITDEAAAMAKSQWRTLVHACQMAERAFEIRGRLNEDVLHVHDA